jgi:hypothetical protein
MTEAKSDQREEELTKIWHDRALELSALDREGEEYWIRHLLYCMEDETPLIFNFQKPGKSSPVIKLAGDIRPGIVDVFPEDIPALGRAIKIYLSNVHSKTPSDEELKLESAPMKLLDSD